MNVFSSPSRYLRFCCSALTFALIGLMVLSLSSQVSATGGFSLRPLLGKNISAYERVLGTPRFVTPSPLKAESLASEGRYYKVSGLVRVVLTRVIEMPNGVMPPLKKRKLKSKVSAVECQFKKGSTGGWKEALKKLGIPTNGVKAQNASRVATKFGCAVELTGIPGAAKGLWWPAGAANGQDAINDSGADSLTIDIDKDTAI